MEFTYFINFFVRSQWTVSSGGQGLSFSSPPSPELLARAWHRAAAQWILAGDRRRNSPMRWPRSRHGVHTYHALLNFPSTLWGGDHLILDIPQMRKLGLRGQVSCPGPCSDGAGSGPEAHWLPAPGF